MNLAIFFLRARRYSRARAVLEKGLALAPRSAPLSAKLTWVLAACPDPRLRDGARALVLARQACAATASRDPAMLDALAAALAETGQFDQAARTANQAVQLARRARRSDLAAAIEQRALAYAAGRAWRTVP
jgi:tetratricopeptide (TPR) repeat protein